MGRYVNGVRLGYGGKTAGLVNVAINGTKYNNPVFQKG